MKLDDLILLPSNDHLREKIDNYQFEGLIFDEARNKIISSRESLLRSAELKREVEEKRQSVNASIETLGNSEGLDAHVKSAKIRFSKD